MADSSNDSSSEEHSLVPLLSSEDNVSSYNDPEAWLDGEYYVVFPKQQPEAVEEDEEEDEVDEDVDEDDDDDADGDNYGGGADNGGAGDNGGPDDNGGGGGGDNDSYGDSGDEAAHVPPAKRHKKECGSSGAKDSD
jgi:hypothetical protein